jgi:hypothetical protein
MYIFRDAMDAYVSRCAQNGSDSLGLKGLEDFDVGIRGCAT